MAYFSAVAPSTRTLARGIFSIPSYPFSRKRRIKDIPKDFQPMGQKGEETQKDRRNW
jgi:hypothetical protein